MRLKVLLSFIFLGISFEQKYFENELNSNEFENETSDYNETLENQTFKIKIFKGNVSVYDIIFDK